MDFSANNRINGLNNNKNEVSFSGQRAMKSNDGVKVTRFFPPYIEFDPQKEELGIELVRMANTEDKNGPKKPYEWSVVSEKPIRVAVDEEFAQGKKNYFDVNLASLKYRMPSGELGYRYVVYDKSSSDDLNKKTIARDKNGNEKVYTDSVGTAVDSNAGKFTVILLNQGTPRLSGPMEHIFLDSYNVIHKEAAKTNESGITDSTSEVEGLRRTHFNKFGGDINGLTEKLNTELRANKLIMTNPMIGGGLVSSHMYHPANHFRISEGIGNKNDFLNLIKECYKSGKFYVVDGAFTSQGYEGLQLSHALKWSDSAFKYWFKNPSKDGFELGVLPDTDNKYTGIRVVNPKGVKGYDYDPSMPTYIQFYDTRLATPEQLEDKGSLIREYANKMTDDPYEITTHQDAVLCNFFEVDPSAKPFVGKDYGSLRKWQEDGLLTDVLAPENLPYRFTKKDTVGGLTGWDGNIDLVKLNLSNHINDKDMKDGSTQARNHMYNVARYWTEEARNAIIMEVATKAHEARESADDNSAIKEYLNKIEKTYKLDENSLVDIFERIRKEKRAEDKESIKVDKSYHYNIADDKRDADTYLTDKMLGFPLESLDFSPELLAVLSTPMITPRPSGKLKADASKTEILKYAMTEEEQTKEKHAPKKLVPSMKKVYSEVLPATIKTLCYDVQKQHIDDSGKPGSKQRKQILELNGNEVSGFTPYGKYFMEFAIDDIMTFLITEGLFANDKELFKDDKLDAFPVYRDGSLDFGYIDEAEGTKGFGKRLTLKRLGINATSQENEAEEVAAKLEKGLRTLKENKPKQYNEFIEYLNNKYMQNDLEDYKIAEATLDQTQGGLDWRFDAAKDVADWDEVNEIFISSENSWNDVNSFWGGFIRPVRKINESSYDIGEVTSLGDFDKGDWGKYKSADGVEWPAAKPERVCYEETGMTTGSNYGTFFGLYPKLFGQNIEEGKVENFRSLNNFLSATNKFLQPVDNGHASSEFIIGSHVFLDNHDKPRAAHLMAVDSALFWGDFKKDGGIDPKAAAKAEKVLERKYSDDMSSKAVAVGEKYLEYFSKRADELKLDKDTKAAIKKSIVHLANGRKYKDERATIPSYRKAEGFATTPFEISIVHVIDQAETFGATFTPQEKKYLADNVRKDMVRPYISKMTAIYEMMRGTAGIPTLFAGDEFAQTGAERKSKNWDLGCRNMVRHDWLDTNIQDDVVAFNTRLQEAGLLDNEPGMGALADGTPIVLNFKDPEAPAADPIFKQGEALAAALEFIGNNNGKDGVSSCTFTNAVQNVIPKKEDGKYDIDAYDKLSDKAKDDLKKAIVKELFEMSPDDLYTKYEARTKELKTENPGLYGWLLTNTEIPGTETGAVYKYNDKGEGVLTVMTNAYIPTSPESSALLTQEDGVQPPKVSDVILKDANGNLIAKPGTIFVRKVYDEETGKYIDDTENGNYRYTAEGKLVNSNNNPTTLDSTITYFYKQLPKTPLYTNISRPIG